jgi:hypothetical protein
MGERMFGGVVHRAVTVTEVSPRAPGTGRLSWWCRLSWWLSLMSAHARLPLRVYPI